MQCNKYLFYDCGKWMTFYCGSAVLTTNVELVVIPDIRLRLVEFCNMHPFGHLKVPGRN